MQKGDLNLLTLLQLYETFSSIHAVMLLNTVINECAVRVAPARVRQFNLGMMYGIITFKKPPSRCAHSLKSLAMFSDMRTIHDTFLRFFTLITSVDLCNYFHIYHLEWATSFVCRYDDSRRGKAVQSCADFSVSSKSCNLLFFL